MKKIVSIILAVIIMASFAGCNSEYTEKDIDDAYSKGWKECEKYLASLEPVWGDEWEEGYDRGYADGVKEANRSSSPKTEYIYTGDEEAINDACAHIDDAYGYLNKTETEINIEYYDDALFYLDEARSEIIKALDILGY